MSKKTISAAIFTVFLLLLSPAATQMAFAQESNPLTDLIQIVYNDQNGLPTSEANAVLQTADGYLWIGGYGGLVRYDGREFCNYSTEESGLTSSAIRALFEDRDGNLWVGTNDKGVFLYENGVFSPCAAPESDLLRSIRCFAQDTDGTVFVGTSTGLAKIGTDNRLLPVALDALGEKTIYNLSTDQHGALWGTAGAGLAFAIKDGELAYLFEPGDLSDEENYVILAAGNTVYIGTGGSTLLRLTLTDGSYAPNSYRLGRFDTGLLSTANALYRTEAGELWLGCNTGSGWFDSNMQLHTLDNLDQNIFLSCITQDYEGNLWFASTQGGVFQLTHGKFQNANRTAGLEGKSINAVVQLDKLLYIASDSGLYLVDANWNPMENELTQRLAGVRIRHLCVDSAGDLWISTYSDLALLRYTPATGALLSVTQADGLLSNKVRKAIELKNGDLAVASTSGVNLLRDGVVTESYGQQQGLDNPMVLCLLEASDGALLAGSDGMGIYVIKDGKVSHIGTEQGLTSGVVLRMREDEKANGVWISAGNGLYLMDGAGNVREITEFRYGLGSVFDILVMDEDIWLMKSSGLIAVPRAALLGKREMSAVQYGRESGLTANLTANAWNLFEGGKLYLCSVGGVFLLESGSLPQNSIPPKIAINEIEVQLADGRTTVYPNPSALTLPGDTRRVTVRFACLSFAGTPGTVCYQLENFDDEPITVSARQTEAVSYTNLRGGEYVFHLSAENADGAAAADLAVTITKELWLFERSAFWAGLAALSILISVLAYRLVLGLKTRQLRRRQQEYKAITDQALKTIANTIDAKDKYTKGHSVRVAGYSKELARRLGLSDEEQENIYYIALLHDIGKIGIPDAILNKPGKLTGEEFEMMISHTLIGGEILGDFTALPHIEDGALSHHENYDGSGYPAHQHGEEIPLVARIIRAADSYDAMATNRAYRPAMSTEYILSEFQKFSGIQFDPHIAKLVADMIAEGFVLAEEQ